MFDDRFIGAVSAPLVLILEAALKGTAVLVLAALLVLALRRASAAHRHLVWACALAAIAVLPALLAALPAWSVRTPALVPSWLASGFDASSPALESRTGVIPPAGDAAGARATPAPGPQGQPAVAPAAPPTSSPATPGRATAAAGGRVDARPSRLSWPALALALWAIGAFLVLATFVAGHLVLWLMLRRARPVRDGEWHALATEAADHLGLTLPFALVRGEGIPVPVACGFIHPRVLLPVACDAWPVELRRAVLVHELAHIQRYDCLTQAIAQVACAMFWFHPGVWWAASRLRIEREHACDDRVLATRTRASDYADQLLGIVRSLRVGRLAALGAVPFARPSSLEGRVLAMLDPRRDRRSVSRRVAAPAALAASLVILPFAALEPVGQAAEATTRVRDQSVDASALLPARVMVVPEPERSLEQRTAWARTHAGQSDASRWWIGWRVETVAGMKGNLLSDTDGIHLDLLGRRGAFTLDDVLAGRSQGTWKAGDGSEDENEARPAAMLVRIASGTPDRVRVQSLGLPAEFGGEPLYWMDAVPDEQAFAWLRDAADGAGSERLRAKFVESIGYLSRSDLVWPYLKSTFESGAPTKVRVGAAEALSRHPSPEGVRLLVKGAQADRSPQVRRACVEALGYFQTPEALEALLAIARAAEGPKEVRRAAFDALGEKVSRQAPRSEAPKHAKSTPKPTKTADQWSPKEGGSDTHDPDSEPGVEASQVMSSAEIDVQRQAIESLGRYPEAQSLPRLRRIAETSPHGELRGQAVESIGRLGTPGALALLEEIVWKNPHPQARERAVEALGRRFPADQALEKLSRIAGSHPSPGARRMAVEMVGRVKSPRSLEMLDRIVANGLDDESRRQAVESLGRRDDEGIETRLLQIARTHGSLEVRRQAVESLGRRKGEENAGLLLEIAREEGPEEVQRQAAESLGRLDHPGVKSMLMDLVKNHGSVQVERQAVESLGRLEVDVLPELAEIARSHRSSEVRRQAVDAMTRRDPDRALPLLEEILRGAPSRNGR
jgi:HEAT repeat protein/beta-lactamase regulating signal transducer with metallopeptidase domain